MTSGAPTSPRSAAAACPSDKTFTRLLEGALSDAELQALQAHGDGCAACGRTLAELARTMTPGGGDWLDQRYQLLEPLGIGGMGVVYTAFDNKLQRKVAVKRLREMAVAASADRRRARFLREARLLASLSHPNVLTVHDVGGVDPELYVVMELVDGWPMSSWISEAVPRPDWRRILDLYVQVGHGLAAAHQLGVVHRDVKPENILVARSGRVLIGDFGLAGLAEAVDTSVDPSTAPAGLTQTGAVLGTPAYMAPEQHDGRPADMLSDQFSFCVSLFESLHGRRPFPGQTAAEIAAAVRAGRPVAGGDGVPRAVDRAVARGLAADPTQRHPSMNALLGALTGARDPRPLKPLLIAGAIGVVLAATTTTAIVTRSRVQPSIVAIEPAPPVKREPAIATPPAPPPSPADPDAGPARSRREEGGRGARRGVGAAPSGDRCADGARRRRRLARRSQRRGVSRVAQQDSHGCLAPGAQRPRAAPARHLRDVARQLRQGTPPAGIARRWNRRPRHAARELPGEFAADDRRSDRRGQRAGGRRPLRGQQAGAPAGAEAGVVARDHGARRSRPASATATHRGRAAGGSRRWRAPTRCWPSRSWWRASARRAPCSTSCAAR